MSYLPTHALASLLLVLSATGCSSSSLSPYADYPEPDSDEGPAIPSAPIASPTPRENPSPPRVGTPTFPTPPAAPAPPIVMAPPAPPPTAPSVDPSQTLPCQIQDLTVDCPSADAMLRAVQDLPCRSDQLGHRCAYPSADDGRVNLLECAASEDGRPDPHWAFRQARCSRSCLNDFPHSFFAFAMSSCADRPLYPCDGAATEQEAVDNALKNIQRQCGGPSSAVLGLLLGDDGCGQALFIEDTALGKCAAEALTHVRFACAPRCASTKEADNTLLK